MIKSAASTSHRDHFFFVMEAVLGGDRFSCEQKETQNNKQETVWQIKSKRSVIFGVI